MSGRLVILGAGGHAVSVADVFLAGARADISLEGFVAPEPLDHWPLEEFPVLGEDGDLKTLCKRRKLTHFLVGVGSVCGGAEARHRLFELGRAAGLEPAMAVHPAAVVSLWARLGPGTVVMAGAVINARSHIGSNVIVNTGAVVDHDAEISDHVHIAPGAVLSGGVAVGEGSLIGVGAIIRQGLSIASDVTVAAGAVVITDVPAGATVLGVPGRLRES